MFKLTKEDFVEEVDEVLTVGEFYELAAGGEIIFT
jgi:peroxiredoxin family protein